MLNTNKVFVGEYITFLSTMSATTHPNILSSPVFSLGRNTKPGVCILLSREGILLCNVMELIKYDSKIKVGRILKYFSYSKHFLWMTNEL